MCLQERALYVFFVGRGRRGSRGGHFTLRLLSRSTDSSIDIRSNRRDRLSSGKHPNYSVYERRFLRSPFAVAIDLLEGNGSLSQTGQRRNNWLKIKWMHVSKVYRKLFYRIPFPFRAKEFSWARQGLFLRGSVSFLWQGRPLKVVPWSRRPSRCEPPPLHPAPP